MEVLVELLVQAAVVLVVDMVIQEQLLAEQQTQAAAVVVWMTRGVCVLPGLLRVRAEALPWRG